MEPTSRIQTEPTAKSVPSNDAEDPDFNGAKADRAEVKEGSEHKTGTRTHRNENGQPLTLQQQGRLASKIPAAKRYPLWANSTTRLH